MKKETIVVTFSGGRTSGYMCYMLQTYLSHIYDFKYCFMNTGQEHEKTLEFVDKVDKQFNLNLVWLEAVINPKYRAGTTHKIVSFETACRDGYIFERLIAKFGLPDMHNMHCTRELKLRALHHWKKTNGYKDNRTALGIRYDEFRRVKNDKGYIFPLATIFKSTKQEVLEFWKEQPFDLEIPEHLGNCTWCYKKSDAKLKMVANDMPEAFDFIRYAEDKYSMIKNCTEYNLKPRKIFRHNRTADDIFNDTGLPYIPSWLSKNKDTREDIENCGEECGVITLAEFNKIEKERNI